MEFTSDWFTRHIPLWRRVLRRFVDRPIQALEIGSHEGRSAIWLLQTILTHPAARLTCVDPWFDAEVEARFDANLLESGGAGRLIKRKATSVDALPHLRTAFSLIYIDGSHEACDVLQDAVLSWRLLQPGGVLIFDDYRWHGRCRLPPRVAIDAFLLIWSDQMRVLEQRDQVIIEKRP
jgi:predicted O-methyltransferase YrrM